MRTTYSYLESDEWKIQWAQTYVAEHLGEFTVRESPDLIAGHILGFGGP